MASTLKTLVPELQVAIVDYVHTLSYLSELSLTCRSLRDAATPKLFEAVTIDLSSCRLPQLNGFFLHNNRGHAHVRRLTFEQGPQKKDKGSDENQVVRLAVGLVSRHRLLQIILPVNLPADRDLLTTLALQQHNLENLALPSRSALHEILKYPICPTKWLATLTSLELMFHVDNLDELRAYNQVLRRARGLQSLTVHGDSSQWGPDGQDSLISTLFSHIAPHGEEPPLGLDSLCLVSLSVANCRRNFMQVIDFGVLQDFQLLECEKPAELLNALADLYRADGCALKHISFDDSDDTDIQALERFLKCCTMLESVWVVVIPESRPAFDPRCLLQHAQTLKWLGLSIRSPYATPAQPRQRMVCPLSPSSAEQLSLASDNMTQLAVGLPQLTLSERSSVPGDEYLAAIAAYAKIPKLRVLRVLNWPKAPNGLFPANNQSMNKSTEMQELSRCRYQRLLDGFARVVLLHIIEIRRAAGLNRFGVLCFGEVLGHNMVYQEDCHGMIDFPNVCYVPIQQTDMLGQTSVAAQRMTPQELERLDGTFELIHDF